MQAAVPNVACTLPHSANSGLHTSAVMPTPIITILPRNVEGVCTIGGNKGESHGLAGQPSLSTKAEPAGAVLQPPQQPLSSGHTPTALLLVQPRLAGDSTSASLPLITPEARVKNCSRPCRLPICTLGTTQRPSNPNLHDQQHAAGQTPDLRACRWLFALP